MIARELCGFCAERVCLNPQGIELQGTLSNLGLSLAVESVVCVTTKNKDGWY